MKKTAVCAMSLLMSAMTALTPVAAAAWTAPQETEWASLDRNNVKVRFAVGSDLHIGRDNNASEKLKNAIDSFYKVDEQLDAAVFCGDLTNNGSTTEYTSLINILNEKIKSGTKLGLMMGNHEFNTASGAVDRYKNAVANLREDINAQDTNNDIVVGDGYHIITMSAKNYAGDYRDNYEWLKAHLENAVKEDPNKPIFLMQHHGIKNTAYVTNEWYGTFGEIETLLKQYPQVIDFSGHSHATLNDPRSINQDFGFTAIQDGTIGAYFENETGKMEGTRPANSEIASQGLIVEVDANNQVTLRRMDFTDGKYIGKSWTVNTPELVAAKNFPYTTEKRTQESAVPTFKADAKLDVSDVTETTAKLTFTQGENEDRNDDGWVHSYRIKAINQETGTTDLNKLTFSDFYQLPMKETLTRTISGLQEDTAYTIEVTAINPFQKESTQKLTAKLQTKTSLTEEELQKEAPKADLLDVSFEDGTAKDVSEKAHTVKTIGTPVIEKEESIGKNAAYFDGSSAFAFAFDEAEYKQLQQGYTMECMMQLDSKGNPFSDQESAGAGFELNSDEKTLEFWSRHGSGYVKPTTQIDKTKWVHAIAVYDGENLKLYVNGKLKDIKTTNKNAWVIPAEGARYFFVGGDTNKTGGLQNPMKGKVSAARIYSRALSIGEITKLYWKEAPTTITVDPNASFEANEGESFTLPTATAMVKATGENAKVQMTVKDSNNQEVTMENGTILANDTSYTVIYTANGTTVEKTITVIPKEDPQPSHKAPSVIKKRTLTVGKKGYYLTVKHRANDAKVSFKIENNNIASISSDGYLTAKSQGTTYVETTVIQNGQTYHLKTEVIVKEKKNSK